MREFFFAGTLISQSFLQKDDKWIRVVTKKGQLVVLPAGCYHRFVPDEKLYFHAMRLFQEEPVWTPYNRGTPEADESEHRRTYANMYLKA